MGLVNLSKASGNLTLQQFINHMNAFADELSHLLNHLDVQNIRAEGIETKNLKAGAVTADKITVNELSALSANLGHITAGLIEAIQIFGSYIATANGTFPRIEINSVGNYLRAYQSPANFTELAPNIVGAPGLHFSDGTTNATILTSALFGGALAIGSSGDIFLSPGSSDTIIVPDWSQVYSNGDFQTLQTALDSLSSNIDALFSMYSSLDARVLALEGA